MLTSLGSASWPGSNSSTTSASGSSRRTEDRRETVTGIFCAGRSSISLTTATITGVIAVAISVPPDQILETTIAAATALIAAITRVTGLKPLRRAGAGGGVEYGRVRESAGMVETRGDAGVSTVAAPCYESSR